MPKSVPCIVLNKVKQVLITEVLNSNVLVQNVPNKSLSQELNNVLFCSCCCKDVKIYLISSKKFGQGAILLVTILLPGLINVNTFFKHLQ